MSWHDVVRTTCYLRDMSRDYEDFNKIRTSFYSWHELDPLPASTGIQAILCWEDLLVEIEAWAICKV
jgi:enamine deaminase RidA (YjgF/YER057c/UK114 family)